ncbi:fatty acid--CoA ligase [Actinomadura meridiana]|uniref:Fatty acid--CoA ligase n=1 Tax=Actinomadura meridiana TaxID=559626 RepID=A0ABP8BWW2_9ACTN
MNLSKPTTIHAVLAEHAAHRPGQDAVLCQDRRVSYAELHRRSDLMAGALVADGARPGTRVVYLGQESEYFYLLLYACAKAGAVLVPVNWKLTAPEVEHVLRDSAVRFAFVEPDYLPVAERAAADLAPRPTLLTLIPDLPGGGPALAGWVDGASESVPVPPGDAEAPIVQMYTSGTTGLPKGVVLAHRSFFQVRDALADDGLTWIDFRDGDVSLIGVPGFHVGGLWWAIQGLNAGVANVSLRTFAAADAVAHIRRHRVTTVCVVPAMLRLMLAERSVVDADFASLRKVVYGGSPIDETLLGECLARVGCEFAQIYGLTESGNTAVCLPPSEHVVGGPRMKAAGRPYPGFAIEIRDEGAKPLPEREIGEVWIRTPARMVEYWRQPEETARTLVDGWLRTGDAGYVEDGYLFIRDRIKDTIIVAGENVYPAEVDNALAEHADVADVAVVGIPDERWGEAVHAFVVPVPGATVKPRELMLFLRGRLADFKVPTSYSIVDALPRNASGKILRRELRDAFWQDRARQVN